MASIIYSQIVLNPEQLAAIGKVAVEATYCESSVEQLIWVLAKMDRETGSVFTQPMSMSVRLETLRTLGLDQLKTEALREEFRALVADMKEAVNERNLVIHGVWNAHPEDLQFLHLPDEAKRPVALKERRNTPPREFPAADVQKLVVRLDRCRTNLFRFSFREFKEFWNTSVLRKVERIKQDNK